MSSHLIFVIGGSKMGIDFYVAALFRFFFKRFFSFLLSISHPFANANLKLLFLLFLYRKKRQ